MFLITAIVFTLLQWICAFFLVIFSVHGPSSLPALTLFWLIVIQTALWSAFILFRRSKNRYAAVYLVFLGILTTASAPLIYFIAEKYDAHRWHNIITNTKIYDVQDELLLTGDGQPFGIRLSFRAEFPYTDYNYVTPVMRPQSDRDDTAIGPNEMRVLRYSTTPALEKDYYFRKGITYHIVFDMVPRYLIPKPPGTDHGQPEFCLQYPVQNVQTMTHDEFEQLVTTGSPHTYLLMLHGTGYGDIYSGREPAFSRNRYIPGDFFRTYKTLNIEECRWPSQNQ
jgi:hypothetical protein